MGLGLGFLSFVCIISVISSEFLHNFSWHVALITVSDCEAIDREDVKNGMVKDVKLPKNKECREGSEGRRDGRRERLECIFGFGIVDFFLMMMMDVLQSSRCDIVM